VFSPEFKRDAVALLEKGDKDAARPAGELGVKRSHLYRWKEEIDAHGRQAILGHGKRNPQTSTDEAVRSRAENRRLQKENEILKKTAIYFAKESK
jgi:transposase